MKEKKRFNDAIIDRFLSSVSSLGENIREVYLFGSRCRKDWRPDSDYDFLIVVDQKGKEVISQLYEIVMDILLDTGRLVSLKIFTASEFNRLASIPTPFIQNVIKEGTKLGLRHSSID